jgi:hypothetical protein
VAAVVARDVVAPSGSLDGAAEPLRRVPGRGWASPAPPSLTAAALGATSVVARGAADLLAGAGWALGFGVAVEAGAGWLLPSLPVPAPGSATESLGWLVVLGPDVATQHTTTLALAVGCGPLETFARKVTVQPPAGSRVNVRHVPSVADPDTRTSGRLMPATEAVTELAGLPAGETYCTDIVNTVATVPLPGETLAARSWFGWAANAEDGATTSAASIARTTVTCLRRISRWPPDASALDRIVGRQRRGRQRRPAGGACGQRQALRPRRR